MFLNNQPDDDSPESKHVAINMNSIVVVLTNDILQDYNKINSHLIKILIIFTPTFKRKL
jgi:hypothetical protein